MNDRDWLAERFEEHRPHLRAVAYRMLGSVGESDDAVQEAWLRLSRSDSAAVANLGGWLTTVVSRVCIDILRARRSRREEYVGSWLPEPIVSVDEYADPEREALLSDSVGLALLVVLETLSPAERLAFVLHDMFGVPFEEIAEIVERTPEAARQLASRARRRVRGAAPSPDRDHARQREIVDAFRAASGAGDFEALLRMLAPDVVFRTDAGLSPRAQPPIEGSEAVATYLLEQGPRFAPYARPALVNGSPGFVVGAAEAPTAVVGFTVVDGLIVEIGLIIDPDKLRWLRTGA